MCPAWPRGQQGHGGSSSPGPRGSFPTKRNFFLVPETSLIRQPSTEHGSRSPVFGLLVPLLSGCVCVEVPCTQVVMLLLGGGSARPHFSPGAGGKILDTAHLYSVFESGTESRVGNCSSGFGPQLHLPG